MKACPYCAEEIQDAAIVCRHCGRELSAASPEGQSALSAQQRAAALDAAIAANGRHDMRIESRSEFQAVLVYGSRPNHVMHFLLGVLTCSVWWFVWLVIAMTSQEQRRILTIDPYGRADLRLPSGSSAQPMPGTPWALQQAQASSGEPKRDSTP